VGFKSGGGVSKAALDLVASSALLADAYDLDSLVATVATSDSSGAALTGTVRWPRDGAAGAFEITRDAGSAVTSYIVTHVLSGVTKTYTQPALTRDASGAVTNRPAITVV